MNELIAKKISLLNRFQSRYINKEFKAIGLAPQQHVFLLQIEDNPGISYSELAKLVYADKTSTTKMIDRLIKKELILLLTSETDKRKRELYLTFKGAETLASVKKILQNLSKEYTHYMSDDEVSATEILLERMLKSIADDCD